MPNHSHYPGIWVTLGAFSSRHGTFSLSLCNAKLFNSDWSLSAVCSFVKSEEAFSEFFPSAIVGSPFCLISKKFFGSIPAKSFQRAVDALYHCVHDLHHWPTPQSHQLLALHPHSPCCTPSGCLGCPEPDDGRLGCPCNWFAGSLRGVLSAQTFSGKPGQWERSRTWVYPFALICTLGFIAVSLPIFSRVKISSTNKDFVQDHIFGPPACFTYWWQVCFFYIQVVVVQHLFKKLNEQLSRLTVHHSKQSLMDNICNTANNNATICLSGLKTSQLPWILSPLVPLSSGWWFPQLNQQLSWRERYQMTLIPPTPKNLHSFFICSFR